ncbi:MAG: hypothetical protein QOJ51_6854 [Acidobacteriaceae bacterium]|nr:hypothetical protein [Acidobacteriaceae bacterium]
MVAVGYQTLPETCNLFASLKLLLSTQSKSSSAQSPIARRLLFSLSSLSGGFELARTRRGIPISSSDWSLDFAKDAVRLLSSPPVIKFEAICSEHQEQESREGEQ